MKNWKKSVVAAATALLLGVSLMGCGAKKAESSAAESTAATGTAAESTAAAKTETGTGLRVGALKGPTGESGRQERGQLSVHGCGAAR